MTSWYLNMVRKLKKLKLSLHFYWIDVSSVKKIPREFFSLRTKCYKVVKRYLPHLPGFISSSTGNWRINRNVTWNFKKKWKIWSYSLNTGLAYTRAWCGLCQQASTAFISLDCLGNFPLNVLTFPTSFIVISGSSDYFCDKPEYEKRKTFTQFTGHISQVCNEKMRYSGHDATVVAK